MRHKLHRAFTLLELLAVLVILVALFAILFRTIQGQVTDARKKTAGLQIKGFQEALERFQLDRGTYPTTEQGLNALIYIPNNEMQQPGMQTPGLQPGMPGSDPLAMPLDSMGATVTGTGAMNAPNPADPTGMGGMPPGAVQPGMPGVDPFAMPGAVPGATGADPTMGGPGVSGMPAGSVGTGTTGYAQSVFNPQLYTTLVKRNPPYLENDKGEVPLDPWQQPYHYVYNPVVTLQGVVNSMTGEDKPAIWSNGPDKTENTADDITNWNPATVPAPGTMGQPGADPMNPMGGGVQPDPFSTMQPGMPMQPGVPTDGATPMPFNAPQPPAPGVPGGVAPTPFGTPQPTAPGVPGGATPTPFGAPQPPPPAGL